MYWVEFAVSTLMFGGGDTSELWPAQRTASVFPSGLRRERTAMPATKFGYPASCGLSGCCLAYSSRTAISPGISCSASMISFRPHSARERSATLNSIFDEAEEAALGFSRVWVIAGLRSLSVVSC